MVRSWPSRRPRRGAAEHPRGRVPPWPAAPRRASAPRPPARRPRRRTRWPGRPWRGSRRRPRTPPTRARSTPAPGGCAGSGRAASGSRPSARAWPPAAPGSRRTGPARAAPPQLHAVRRARALEGDAGCAGGTRSAARRAGRRDRPGRQVLLAEPAGPWNGLADRGGARSGDALPRRRASRPRPRPQRDRRCPVHARERSRVWQRSTRVVPEHNGS